MPSGPFIPLLGFAPDLDPSQPGVIVDCQFLLPTLKGMKAANRPTPARLPVLPAQTTGAATVVLLSGTARAFAGMPTKLYEAVSNAWVDVTRVSLTSFEWAAGDPLDAHMTEPALQVAGTPIPYTGTVDNTWRFAQFGNVTIATNGADPLQQSNTNGPFADIAGAPVAALLDVTQGFVFVANTTDATYGQRPDSWYCSALYDQTKWVPDIGTQCATGRLIDTPGPNTACKALGSNIVIYKATSFYYGVYQGPPIIWAFTVVSNNIGVPTQEAVVNIGTAHLFVGNDNFYKYDGTRPEPIGDQLKEWFFANRNPSATFRMRSMYDQRASLVYWFFVSTNSPDGKTLDRGIVFNFRANKWGRADYTVESVFDNISGQMTYDQMGTFYPTWDQLPAVAYESPFWVQYERVPSVIDTTHQVQTLTGAATVSGFKTGEMGDDEDYTDLQYVRLRCLNDPDSGLMSAQHRETLGSNDFQTTTNPYVDGKFDCDVSARWHAFTFVFQGDAEITGYKPTAVKDGEQ